MLVFNTAPFISVSCPDQSSVLCSRGMVFKTCVGSLEGRMDLNTNPTLARGPLTASVTLSFVGSNRNLG